MCTHQPPAIRRREKRSFSLHKLAKGAVRNHAAVVRLHHRDHLADRVDLDREPACLSCVVQRRLHVDNVAQRARASRALARGAVWRLRRVRASQQAHAVGVCAHERGQGLRLPGREQQAIQARVQHALRELAGAEPRRHPRALVFPEARAHEVLMPQASETRRAARGVAARTHTALALHALPAQRGELVRRSRVRGVVAARAARGVGALGDPVRGQRERKRRVTGAAAEDGVLEHGGVSAAWVVAVFCAPDSFLTARYPPEEFDSCFICVLQHVQK